MVNFLSSIANFYLPIMSQLNFSDVEFGAKHKQTRRDIFLADMDKVVPWARLSALIETVYP